MSRSGRGRMLVATNRKPYQHRPRILHGSRLHVNFRYDLHTPKIGMWRSYRKLTSQDMRTHWREPSNPDLKTLTKPFGHLQIKPIYRYRCLKTTCWIRVHPWRMSSLRRFWPELPRTISALVSPCKASTPAGTTTTAWIGGYCLRTVRR